MKKKWSHINLTRKGEHYLEHKRSISHSQTLFRKKPSFLISFINTQLDIEVHSAAISVWTYANNDRNLPSDLLSFKKCIWSVASHHVCAPSCRQDQHNTAPHNPNQGRPELRHPQLSGGSRPRNTRTRVMSNYDDHTGPMNGRRWTKR